MRPVIITRALLTADADGIAVAQTTAGAADLTLNGALVAGGVGQLTSQRKVAGHSTGNISTVVFTVYGTNSAGVSITDTVTGISNTTVSTTLDFLTVTRIAASAAVGTNVEFGTTGVGASQPIPLDLYISPFSVTIQLVVSGTVDGTIEYTADPVLASSGPFTWFALSNLTGITSNSVDTLVAPVAAVRLVTNSGTGSITTTILQAGTGA